MPGEFKNQLSHTAHDFRATWKALFLTDLAFKVVAFVVLTPLTGLTLRGMLACSGVSVLSDVDIAFFLLGPFGWLTFTIVGAFWLGIIALEQASLLSILHAHEEQRGRSAFDALRFAFVKSGTVVRVTGRIVAWIALAVAPFLAVAAVVYFALLGEYDINFYLKEKPPEFLTAVGIGIVILIAMLAVLLRLFSGWFLALPLVLFDDISPPQVLRASAERAKGHRRAIVLWIVGWFVASTVTSIILTGLVNLIGRQLIPSTAASIYPLMIMVGCVLFLLVVVGLAVNLLSTTTFAVILHHMYRELCGGGNRSPAPLNDAEQTREQVALRFTRKQFAIGAIIGVAVAFGIGLFALRSVRVDDDVEVMAHRGASVAAPENTMAAIRQAITDGADWVEIDVQETADGEVVVFHDSDFMRMSNSRLKIWDATRADLTDLDIGSWFDPKFAAERVPTLADVLDECHGKIGVNIELKYYGHDQQLEQRVAEIVEAHDMVEHVKIMSLKMDAVTKFKALRPNWSVGLLMSVSTGQLNKLDADFIAVNASFADAVLINRAHANGKEVYVWTVNDAASMSTMIGRGVDGLLTDDPALARAVLAERAELSAPERLLLEMAQAMGADVDVGVEQ